MNKPRRALGFGDWMLLLACVCGVALLVGSVVERVMRRW